jgi:hypothetical protein
MQSRWWRPTTIILSAIGTNFAAFMHLGAVVPSAIVIWFLFVCPGMVCVHFLHLQESIVEYVLALALSLAIDAIVAGMFLYSGWWSPTGILNVLVSFCLVGAAIQLVCS